MTQADHAGRLKLIIRSQYFLYFGVMGIFLPYFNLYLHHINFTSFQIGALSALRSVLLVLFPVFWSLLADRFQAKKGIYVFCNMASSIVWIFYLYTTDFWCIALITLAYGIFYSPIISFLEAFTMDILGDEKKQYGQIRAWGSVAFISAVILSGRLIDVYPIEIILLLVLAGGIVQSLISTAMPSFPVKINLSLSSEIVYLFNRKTLVFLTSAFLMLVSHGAYYGFFSIHLEKIGFGKTFIGIAWALASIAEIIVMINSARIFKRFSLENILFFSFMMAATRWFLLSFATSAPAILAIQILHSFTYGAFHMASILYIDGMSSDSSRTLGQAVNNAVSYGMGLMAGFFLSGYLYEAIGSSALFMTSGCIALVSGMMLKLYQISFQSK